jgi:hypothetical protein
METVDESFCFVKIFSNHNQTLRSVNTLRKPASQDKPDIQPTAILAMLFDLNDVVARLYMTIPINVSDGDCGRIYIA